MKDLASPTRLRKITTYEKPKVSANEFEKDTTLIVDVTH